MDHILITKQNIHEFGKYLPLNMAPGEDRIIIGAYDDDGVICGVISYAVMAYEYEVDWLYVTPNMRRRGVARGLMDELFRFIKSTGEVLPINIEFEVSEKDMDLFYFFMSIDEMNVSYSHERFYVSSRNISDSQILSKEVMLEFETTPFCSLPRSEQEELLKETDRVHPFVIEDYDMWINNCIRELCNVYYSNGKAVGFILFQNRTDVNIECSYIFSKTPMLTKKMIVDSASVVKKSYQKSGVVFDTVDDVMEHMCRRIFPEAKIKHIYAAEW